MNALSDTIEGFSQKTFNWIYNSIEVEEHVLWQWTHGELSTYHRQPISQFSEEKSDDVQYFPRSLR